MDRRDDPRAQRSIVDHLHPGDVIERQIEVVSTLETAEVIPLYAGSATIRGGEFVPGERGADEGELAQWVSVEPDSLALGPGESARAVVRVVVPSDVIGGERYGAVWAELPPAGDGIRTVNRVGIRLYLSIGTGSEPVSDFEIHTLVARRPAAGTPVVEATVENTGERALDLSGELSLTDGPAGVAAGPFGTQGITTLAPGDSGSMFVELDPELPAGPWLARMTARSGTLEKAVEATITFPEAPGESAAPVDATEVPLHQDRGFLIPLAIGLTLLTLLLLFLAWWLLFYRRRRDEEEEEAPRAPRESGVGA